MVWYGMVWYGMVWYGMAWYGMVWHGMAWYGDGMATPAGVKHSTLSTCQRKKAHAHYTITLLCFVFTLTKFLQEIKEHTISRWGSQPTVAYGSGTVNTADLLSLSFRLPIGRTSPRGKQDPLNLQSYNLSFR